MGYGRQTTATRPSIICKKGGRRGGSNVIHSLGGKEMVKPGEGRAAFGYRYRGGERGRRIQSCRFDGIPEKRSTCKEGSLFLF